MTIADLAQTPGRTYPARRRTQNLAGGASPIQARNFSMGNVTLEPNGLGGERSMLQAGQAVYIPSFVFHQLTNLGAAACRMLYCYGPAGDVAHWRQELDGTLPRAGVDVPPLPEGARPQCTKKP